MSEYRIAYKGALPVPTEKRCAAVLDRMTKNRFIATPWLWDHVLRAADSFPRNIASALSEATDEQIKSEWAKRTQAMRKTKTGGRNGGRPKKSPEFNKTT